MRVKLKSRLKARHVRVFIDFPSPKIP